MKILILTQKFNVGGMTTYVLNLSSYLISQGHEVHIAAPHGDCEREAGKLGCKILTISLPKSELHPVLFKTYKILKKYILENKIDVIHCQSRVTHVLGFWLGKRTGASYVATCHGLMKKKLHRKLFPYWGKNAIAVSNFVKGLMVDDARAHEDRVSVIYHGKEYRPVNKEEEKRFCEKYEISKQGPIIGVVCRLVAWKGCDYLIEAAPDVLKLWRDAQFMIAGDGEERPRLEKLVKKLGLEHNVRFVGTQSRVEVFYSLCDVCVVPNRGIESFGYTVLEAMMYGKPLILSNLPAMNEIIAGYSQAYLVEPHNIRALAQKINYVLQGITDFSQKAKNDAPFIQSKFSLSAMGNETVDIYRKSLQRLS